MNITVLFFYCVNFGNKYDIKLCLAKYDIISEDIDISGADFGIYCA